jgi:hypothetical protein
MPWAVAADRLRPVDCTSGGYPGAAWSRRLASSSIGPVDSAVVVDFARALRGLPRYKARNVLGCLQQSWGGSNRGGLSRENNAQGRRRSQPNLSYSGSLPFLCALFCIARAQKCLDSCSTLEAVKKDAKNWGRHVGMTEWLLVWLIANALFVVWRVLVVSQAEARDLSLRREGAGRPLSQHALRGRLGR